MSIDAERLYNFYQTPLGLSVKNIINQAIQELWLQTETQTIVSVGYGQPYMNQFQGIANRTIIAMPSGQGAVAWPSNHNNSTVLIDEAMWPFKDETIDKLLIVHSFEYCESKNRFLYEAWRSLKPQGEIIMIVPNKHSIWSRSSKSPFGYGHAYPAYQIEHLLNNFGFKKETVKKVLIIPPFTTEWIVNFRGSLEKINSNYFNKMGGVIIYKAKKHIYGLQAPAQKTWFPKIFKPVNSI